jgi:hypothetical protein
MLTANVRRRRVSSGRHVLQPAQARGRLSMAGFLRVFGLCLLMVIFACFVGSVAALVKPPALVTVIPITIAITVPASTDGGMTSS